MDSKSIQRLVGLTDIPKNLFWFALGLASVAGASYPSTPLMAVFSYLLAMFAANALGMYARYETSGKYGPGLREGIMPGPLAPPDALAAAILLSCGAIALSLTVSLNFLAIIALLLFTVLVNNLMVMQSMESRLYDVASFGAVKYLCVMAGVGSLGFPSPYSWPLIIGLPAIYAASVRGFWQDRYSFDENVGKTGLVFLFVAVLFIMCWIFGMPVNLLNLALFLGWLILTLAALYLPFYVERMMDICYYLLSGAVLTAALFLFAT